MYHVRAEGVDERMKNVHYYYYYLKSSVQSFSNSALRQIAAIRQLAVSSDDEERENKQPRPGILSLSVSLCLRLCFSLTLSLSVSACLSLPVCLSLPLSLSSGTDLKRPTCA